VKTAARQLRTGVLAGRKAPGRRRAFTLIETVVAVTLLATLASVIIMGISMVMGQQVRQQQRLACAEIANRLILQQLDDPESMPDSALPIAYGNEKYRWKLIETPVQLVSALSGVGSELEERSRFTLDRMNAVTIRVWLGEESGGSFREEPSSPFYALSRVIDPVSNVTRNPDSLSYAAGSEKGRARILNVFTGTDRGGVIRGGSRSPSQSGATGQAGSKGSSSPTQPDRSGGNTGGGKETSKGGSRAQPVQPGGVGSGGSRVVPLRNSPNPK